LIYDSFISTFQRNLKIGIKDSTEVKDLPWITEGKLVGMDFVSSTIKLDIRGAGSNN
jgi:hypothetical protein